MLEEKFYDYDNNIFLSSNRVIYHKDIYFPTNIYYRDNISISKRRAFYTRKKKKEKELIKILDEIGIWLDNKLEACYAAERTNKSNKIESSKIIHQLPSFK